MARRVNKLLDRTVLVRSRVRRREMYSFGVWLRMPNWERNLDEITKRLGNMESMGDD